MSDLASNVIWQEILAETESGSIPHCRAIAAPMKFHQEIIEVLARKILGSYRPEHPDLIVSGSQDKAPNIELCRQLIADIALKPLESSRRLGVIMSADKLLLPAANSLLKLAEEPPSHAVLLFLMEDGRLFLPTLRSRSRFSTIVIAEKTEAHSFPRNDSELLKWIAEARKTDAASISDEFGAWAEYALNEKNFPLAERMDSLRLIAGKKNLSAALLCDLIILTLREDNNNNEYILDDFR